MKEEIGKVVCSLNAATAKPCSTLVPQQHVLQLGGNRPTGKQTMAGVCLHLLPLMPMLPFKLALSALQ